MREILFRGKGTIDGEWKYGYYAGEVCKTPFSPTTKQDNIIQLGSNLWCEVVPDTVGQFTGLTDKNGTKIFEGDIVEYEAGDKLRIGRVFFSDFRASFSVTAGKNGSARINNDLFNYIQNGNSVIVIGNIFDNPELIGGTDYENTV